MLDWGSLGEVSITVLSHSAVLSSALADGAFTGASCHSKPLWSLMSGCGRPWTLDGEFVCVGEARGLEPTLCECCTLWLTWSDLEVHDLLHDIPGFSNAVLCILKPDRLAVDP